LRKPVVILHCESRTVRRFENDRRKYRQYRKFIQACFETIAI